MTSERGGSAPWVLAVTAGEDLGVLHTLTRVETSIGRGAGQDFLLNDLAASRRHAVVTRDGVHFRITDLGAANGTTVNGVRITSVLLSEGDEVKLGTTTMRFIRAPWWEESLPPPPLAQTDPVLSRAAFAATIRTSGDEATSLSRAIELRAVEVAPQPVAIAPPPAAAAIAPPSAAPPPEPTDDPALHRTAAMEVAGSANVAPPAAPLIPLAPPVPPTPPAPSLAPPPAPPSTVAVTPRSEEFREGLTALTPGSVLPALPEDLPYATTEADVPDDSKLPLPIVAQRMDGWRVTIGEVLSAYHAELIDLLGQCSGLAFVRGQLVAASGNADFVSFIDPKTLNHRRIDLPRIAAREQAGLRPGAELQIEAVLAARDYRSEFLLAFGSGLHDEARRVVRMRIGGGDFDLAIMDARWLYRTLLALPGFATSTLNIEGAAVVQASGGAPPRVRLCQRGNGRRRGQAQATSATVEILQIVLFGYLERCRRNPDSQLGDDLVNVRRYDLGRIEDVPLGFTDSCGLPGGRMLYVAMAERCIDAGVPGPNFGTAVGIIESDGSARWTPICETDGRPTAARVAAITVDDEGQVYAALQATDDCGARLCRLEFDGVPLRRG